MTATLKDQIAAAIAAHGLWKGRLIAASQSGKSEFQSTKVAVDNACEFGKWLYESIDATAKGSPEYADVKAQHALFHKEAARVLRLIETGKVDEAKKVLAGDYSTVSSKLVKLLVAWKLK